jgi:hypothetical protein
MEDGARVVYYRSFNCIVPRSFHGIYEKFRTLRCLDEIQWSNRGLGSQFVFPFAASYSSKFFLASQWPRVARG